MLGQHAVHDAAVARKEFIALDFGGVPVAVFGLKAFVQPVGHCLVGSEDAEVLRVGVELEDVANVAAELDHVLLFDTAGEGDVHGIVAEIRGAQVPQQLAAVGVGIGRDAPVAGGGQFLQFGD